MNQLMLLQQVMQKLIGANEDLGYFDLREYPNAPSDLIVDTTVELTAEETKAVKWLMGETVT